MSFLTKLRSLHSPLHHHHHQHTRLFSILSPDSTTPLTSLEKTRAALSLLRFEKNPERILDICRAAALTPQSHLDRVAFSTAISKLKQSNYFSGIRDLITQSLTRPDLQSEKDLTHFIVLYGQGGLVNDAVKLFDEMPQQGFPHSVKGLNSLITSCILGGEYGEMKRVFSEFPKKYGVEPDKATFNNVLKGFCESGSADSSYSILSEMERKGVKPDAATFAIIVGGFYKEEKFGDVEKTLELMRKYGVKGGIAVANERIKGLCKLGKSDEARGVLEEVVKRGMKPNCVTYGYLIYGFCKEGKLEVAKALFKEMGGRKLKADALCYFTLVHYLCKGKDFEGALEVYKMCAEKGWVPNITTMKMLVEGLVNGGKVDEAKEIIAVVKEKFSRNAEKWAEIEEGLAKAE